jgi:ketosteroid isomerase-like protein
MVSPSLLHKALPLALLAALWCAPALASDFEDMVAAERAFAADASARNTRDAFLAAYDAQGVAFAPGPVDAQRLWTARKPNKNKLEWTPEVAEIAASGELGYTSGPWRFTAEGEDKPSAFGHFFTIWRKDGDGHWKVLVDHGISHGEAAFPEKVTRRGAIGMGTPPTWPVGLAELRKADLMPAGALDARVVSADFWRLREGLLPGARSSSPALPTYATRVDTGLVIAQSGELAATWGGGVGSPGWIRVWRRPAADDAPGKGWVLVAEVVSSAPEPEPAPEPAK